VERRLPEVEGHAPIRPSRVKCKTCMMASLVAAPAIAVLLSGRFAPVPPPSGGPLNSGTPLFAQSPATTLDEALAAAHEAPRRRPTTGSRCTRVCRRQT
jgi:hypothetical protein